MDIATNRLRSWNNTEILKVTKKDVLEDLENYPPISSNDLRMQKELGLITRILCPPEKAYFIQMTIFGKAEAPKEEKIKY